MTDKQAFLLQRVQPAMVGLIDGSLSTLAPIFSVAIVTHKPHYAFIAGLATAFGAGISMAFSEGLSAPGPPPSRAAASASQRSARPSSRPVQRERQLVALSHLDLFALGERLVRACLREFARDTNLRRGADNRTATDQRLRTGDRTPTPRP